MQTLTENWREMATILLDNKLLAKLSMGDSTSNELYYHGKCYKSYRNSYESLTKKKSKDKKMDNEAVIKAKVVEFMILTE